MKRSYITTIICSIFTVYSAYADTTLYVIKDALFARPFSAVSMPAKAKITVTGKKEGKAEIDVKEVVKDCDKLTIKLDSISSIKIDLFHALQKTTEEPLMEQVCKVVVGGGSVTTKDHPVLLIRRPDDPILYSTAGPNYGETTKGKEYQ